MKKFWNIIYIQVTRKMKKRRKDKNQNTQRNQKKMINKTRHKFKKSNHKYYANLQGKRN